LVRNGRAVRDKLLMNAVRVAYRGVLMEAGTLRMSVSDTGSGKLVDVNAHPSKLEVRSA